LRGFSRFQKDCGLWSSGGKTVDKKQLGLSRTYEKHFDKLSTFYFVIGQEFIIFFHKFTALVLLLSFILFKEDENSQ